MDEGKKVGGYTLVNLDKVDRAIHGSPNDKGMPVGGVADADGKVDNAALLAEYDRIGGLIMKNGDKVKTGSFYDFPNRKPFEKPKVNFVYKVNGQFITVPEGKDLPGEVKAAQIVEKAKKAVKKKK